MAGFARHHRRRRDAASRRIDGHAETRRGGGRFPRNGDDVVFFRSSHKPRNEEASRLGFRSPLVLAKLGFDLRDRYEEALSQPLPERLRRSLDRLDARARRPERRLALREQIGALTRPGAWWKLRGP
jgi:hypothetical protein